MVLGQSLWLIVPGVAAGLVAALIFTRLLESLLFGIPAWDVLTFAAVVTVILAVGTFAAFLPARRATRIDPIFALRPE
jgi:putative ABC transport system permease protein